MTSTDIVVKHTHGDRAETKQESVLTPSRRMHLCVCFEIAGVVLVHIGITRRSTCLQGRSLAKLPRGAELCLGAIMHLEFRKVLIYINVHVIYIISILAYAIKYHM